ELQSMVTNTVPPPSPKRFLSDHCDLCNVRGCHIQSQIEMIEDSSVFDFKITNHSNRRLDIIKKPLIIRGFEDGILMFEYHWAENVTYYFFEAFKPIKRMDLNAAEFISGTAHGIEDPYNKNDPPEVWSNRLANHNVFIYEKDT